jgi:hypothetical protein
MAFNLTGVIVTNMITELFIPQVRKSLVSRNFVIEKSEVKAESIKIWGVGAVTINDYTGGVVTPTAHVDTSVLLTLDKAKDFNQSVEKIDSEQSALDVLPGIIEAGSYGLANAIDTDVFTMLATTTKLVADPVLDATNVVEWIGDLATELTNNGAPREGRKLSFSPEMVNVLNQAAVVLNVTAAEAAAREGFIGRFGGFDIFETINSGQTAIGAVARGAALGLGFNDLDIENIPGQHFAVAKGLINYGTKLVKEEYVVKSTVTFA